MFLNAGCSVPGGMLLLYKGKVRRDGKDGRRSVRGRGINTAALCLVTVATGISCSQPRTQTKVAHLHAFVLKARVPLSF